MIRHYPYMRRCIELAADAAGYTSPNPMVGCVIVHNGRIIGEGYHHEYGAPHAEVNAIRSVSDKSLLKDSTLYVSLEPCSHYGKTPPCADLIISSGIPTVVTGSSDPNPLVSGRGIARLRSSGCHVTEHVMENDCDRLNIRFMTYHREKRPYIVLKWAQTEDGFIDIHRSMTARPTWITGEEEQALVHKWRSEEQAVMVGTNTAFLDNPMLNVRKWHGKQPIRVVIDRTLRLPASLNIFDGSQPTIVFSGQEPAPGNRITYLPVTFDRDLPRSIIQALHQQNILSVMIEGGQQLLQSFIDAGLWDEARIFTGRKMFGDGVPAPRLTVSPLEETTIFKNSILHIYSNYSRTRSFI